MYKATAIIHGAPISLENTIDIVSPITNKSIGTIPILSDDHIKDAFNSAEIAYDSWRTIDSKIRQKFLLKFADKLREHAILLTTLLHEEIGKSQVEAKQEIDRSVEYIVETVLAYDHITDNPEEYDEENNILVPKNLTATYLRQPWGVALTISPFNYPINLMITKIVPAILMGNCVVHKSATQGSLCGWYISRLFNDLAIEENYQIIPGVLNYITGQGRDINAAISTCANISIISFTGSTNIGYLISKQFPHVPKQLEMGGLNTAIVMADADISFSISEILKGAFSFSGQRCTSIQKVLVHHSIEKKIIQEMQDQIHLHYNKETPLINKQSLENLKTFYQDAISRGAKLITEDNDLMSHKNLVVQPTIISNINKEMMIYSEEIFAPIIGLMTFSDAHEAVHVSNDNKYGLQCSVFGENLDVITAMSLSLNFGRININKSPSRSPDILPFSAFKASGLEVQGIKNSLYFFSRFKGVILNKRTED